MLKNIILFPHKLGQLKNGVEKTPVDNGLLLDETIEIFNKLNDKNLVNMDLTELNLNIGAAIGDKDFDSFSNVIKILHKYIS